MSVVQKLGKKRLIIGIIGIIVILLAAVYIAIGIYFQSHFPFHTVINGVDCSGKSVEDVEALITREVEKYQLTITGREGVKDTIGSAQIGLYPEFDGSLQALLKARSGFAWPASLFRETSTELETMVNYDEEKLAEATKGLAFFDAANVKAPEDAHISEYQENKGYEVVPEVEGTTVDEKLLKEALKNSIMNLQSALSLEESDCYQQPSLRSDDAAMTSLVEKLNKCVSTSIIYEFGSDSEKLTGNEIAPWLSVTEDEQVQIDGEAVAAYVKELASRHDTYGMPRNFKTTWGSTVSYSNSYYGWKINQEEEAAKLMADIQEGKQESREPVYSQYGASRNGEDHGGTYVEVNITAQHLYFYKNGSLILDTDFVSGNESKGWSTPSGAYALYYTQKDKTLVGEDYRTPVSFWMPFNGGIGFHDANWRSDFGGNYYKTSGSHGCINMPYSAAKTLFNNIRSGDAVFVYRLSGTESEKARNQDAAAAVDEAIAAIGDVNLGSQPVIASARGAYDALNDQGKGFVKNYDALVNAENVYNSLVQQQQAEEAARAEEEQAKAQAQPVVDAINSIGPVTADKAGVIQNARNAYNALSDKAKGYVSNLSVLIAAEEQLAALQAS